MGDTNYFASEIEYETGLRMVLSHVTLGNTIGVDVFIILVAADLCFIKKTDRPDT
jgi:hypothetical protein